MSCGELDPVRMRTAGGCSSFSSAAAASKPSITGMLMSSATTSGRSVARQLDGLEPVGRSSDDDDPLLRGEDRLQRLGEETVIVRDQDADRRWAAAGHRETLLASCRVTLAAVHPPDEETPEQAARARIQRFLVTGRQPPEAGRRAREGARELRAGARRGARGGARGRRAAARRAQARRPRAARCENLLDPPSLTPDVVQLGGLPGGVVRHGQRGRGPQRLDERVLVERIDEHACLGAARTRAARRRSSRRPAGRMREPRAPTGRTARRATAGRRRPRRRRSRGSGRARPGRSSSTPGRPSSSRPQRPDADERQRSLAEPLERAREPHDVLPLRERADADEPRPGAVGARGRRGSARGRRRSPRPPSCRAPPGTAASSRSRSQPETAITVCGAARRRVASRAGPARAQRRSRRPGRAR